MCLDTPSLHRWRRAIPTLGTTSPLWRAPRIATRQWIYQEKGTLGGEKWFNLGQPIINHPPVITIFIGDMWLDMTTIPNHGLCIFHCFTHTICFFSGSWSAKCLIFDSSGMSMGTGSPFSWVFRNFSGWIHGISIINGGTPKSSSIYKWKSHL